MEAVMLKATAVVFGILFWMGALNSAHAQDGPVVAAEDDVNQPVDQGQAREKCQVGAPQLILLALEGPIVVAQLPDLLRAAGCSLTGCSGCGGFNTNTRQNCPPNSRFCSWRCPGESGEHWGCLPQSACGN